MPDNLTTQSGTPATVLAGSIIATDDVSSVHFQKVKLDVGGDGVSVPASGDATYGLDVDVTRVQGTVAVTGPLTDTELRANAVPVSGPLTNAQLRAAHINVDVSANTIGLATSAKQDTLLAELQLKADLTETQPVSMVVGPASNGVLTRGTLTTALTAAGGNGTIIIAPPSGQFNYITGISIVNAGTVSTSVSLYSGPSATGLLIYRTMAPALGGSNITFPTPLKCRVDEVLAVLIDTTPSGNVWASAVGYTGA